MQPQGSAPPPKASASTLWASVIVFVVLVVGVVSLYIAGRDAAAVSLAGVLALAVPVILSNLKVDRIEQHAVAAATTAQETREVVEEVKDKVNGELRQAAIDAARETGRHAVTEAVDDARAAIHTAAVEEIKRAVRGGTRTGDQPRGGPK